ncbi:MAG: MFS transporter [Candidatus Thorarchaeota archaeon]
MFDPKKNHQRSYDFTSKQIQRNIRIFEITGIDFTVLLVPVIVLVWTDASLEFHEMLLLQGIFALPILLLEVFSGSIADYWSRKNSVTLFHVLFGLGIFLYAIGDNFLMFALAELLAGIGVTFQTGSATALLYDSLKVHHPEPNGVFGKLVAKRMTIMFFFSAFGAIASGFVGSFFMIRLPIYLAVLGHFFFAGLVLWGYTEPPRSKPSTPKAAISSAITSLKKASLQPIVLFWLLYIVFGRVGFWAVQHILIEEFLIDAFAMGLLLALWNGIAALSSLFVRSRVEELANGTVFTLVLAIETGYFSVLIFQPIGLGGILLASCLTQITRGIRMPLIQSVVQQNLQSEERATFSSLMSFLGSFLYFSFSVINDAIGLSRTLTLWSGFACSAILVLCFVMLTARNNQKTKASHPEPALA